jgi:hypothetical protein
MSPRLSASNLIFLFVKDSALDMTIDLHSFFLPYLHMHSTECQFLDGKRTRKERSAGHP